MFLQLLLVLQLSWLTLAAPSSSVAALTQTKSSCEAKCGNITIPYPFGIGPVENGCSLYGTGFDYSITCNTSYNPPKAFLERGDIEVIGISESEIRIKNHLATMCYNESGGLLLDEYVAGMDISKTPFTFSDTKNRFFGMGCSTLAIFEGPKQKNYTSQCLSRCQSKDDLMDGSCSGTGCCQSTIPTGLNMFTAYAGRDTRKKESHTLSFNPCSYAFMAEQEQFTFEVSNLLNGSNFHVKGKDVPVVLEWAIGNTICEEAEKDIATFACQVNSNCSNSDNNPGYRCTCRDGYEGNPYLSPGCRDVNECDDKNNNPCVGMCTNTNGSYICSCPKGSHGDGKKAGSGCIRDTEEVPILKITLGIGLGFLFLIGGSSWLFLIIRKRKLIKRKEEFFKRNGGLLLKQQISSHEGRGIDQSTKIFTAEELKLATKNYDDSRILGRGGYGIVYKGTLSDDRTVAIKKSNIVDESQIEQFINEVVILTQINHRNVVKLLGCCLETEVPLLVYEYVSNGTLSQHIHSKDGRSLSWESRLRIATETAGAIAYLHSAASIPVIHRDIKSANILLDKNYTAKVADFGASRLNPLDQTQISTLVQGTLGYLDPEYFNSGQLTDKSDVYSFGVVLVELLTREKPLSFERSEKQQNLASYFIFMMEENNVLQLIDAQVMAEGKREQVLAVAELGKRCLHMKGEERPNMKEVARELEGLRKLETQRTHDNQRNHEEKTNIQYKPTDLYAVPLISTTFFDSSHYRGK